MSKFLNRIVPTNENNIVSTIYKTRVNMRLLKINPERSV